MITEPIATKTKVEGVPGITTYIRIIRVSQQHVCCDKKTILYYATSPANHLLQDKCSSHLTQLDIPSETLCHLITQKC